MKQFANELIAALNKVVEEREQKKLTTEESDAESKNQGEYLPESSDGDFIAG